MSVDRSHQCDVDEHYKCDGSWVLITETDKAWHPCTCWCHTVMGEATDER